MEDFEADRAGGFQALLVRQGEPPRPDEQICSLAEALLRREEQSAITTTLKASVFFTVSVLENQTASF